MTRYPTLPEKLKDQLDRIAPSDACGVTYYPCAVTLDDGSELEGVYIVEYEPYFLLWGITPEKDPGKQSIPIDRVVAIRESSDRLPPKLAEKLYKTGESGMGYYVFTVRFSGGSRQAYVMGNAVDFITPPKGLTAAAARKVYPHVGRDASPQEGPDYYWCLYQDTDKAI